MRRLTLAAICGLLAMSACTSDDRSPTPTEPGPETVIVPRCRPTRYPVAPLTIQIIKIFPVAGGLQANALVRNVAIGALWTVCKTTDAQAGVASFVKFMVQQFQANKLIGGKSSGSSQRVLKLTNDLYSAVGLKPPQFPPEALGDGNNFGNGLFVPGTQKVINTGNFEAGTVIPPNGFNQPTLITIFRRSTSGFTSPPQPVFGPFYEITASNADGKHYLNTGEFAVVGFCADADDLLPPPPQLNDPAIAHQAIQEGTNPGGFEVLDPNAVTTAQYISLGLSCPRFPSRIGALDMGSFKGFAMSAWRHTTHYAGPVLASVLLPDEAQAAAAMAAGKSGLGGLARSLSPFAVTDRGGNTSEFSFDPESFAGQDRRDPSGQEFFFDGDGVPIRWFGYSEHTAYPGVLLKDSEGEPVGGVLVTAELISADAVAGVPNLTGNTAVSTASEESENVAAGEALFDELFMIGDFGFGEDVHTRVFKLKFTAPGFPPLESGTFHVDEPSY